jgi:AcrR family transcriptional regulator
MARRSDHSRDEIRAMALASASATVAAEGLAGLTTRKVAQAIGYTVGTLYLVFRNLDDVVLHVNAATLDDLFDRLLAAGEEFRGEARILAYARAYIHYAGSEPGRWGALYEHRMAGSDVPQWYLDKVARHFEPVEEGLGEMMPDATRADVRLAARALWGGVHGICLLGLTDKLAVANVDSALALADSLVGNYLAGWRVRSEARMGPR